jgi:saccharopine dehydrogenase-like NADP-dependent oxidoreductase
MIVSTGAKVASAGIDYITQALSSFPQFARFRWKKHKICVLKRSSSAISIGVSATAMATSRIGLKVLAQQRVNHPRVSSPEQFQIQKKMKK